MIESISAITLATHDMARAVRFYRVLGFEIINGGDDAAFTSFRAGRSYLNLIAQPAERKWSWWGRVIFYHSDVDALHARVVATGYRPDTPPDRPRCTRAQFRLASAMRRRHGRLPAIRGRHASANGRRSSINLTVKPKQ